MSAWRMQAKRVSGGVGLAMVVVAAVVAATVGSAVTVPVPPAGAVTPPVVTGVSPGSGPAAGGTLVSISGLRFGNPLSSVSFGGSPALFARTSGRTVVALAPPHAAGTVDIIVTDGAGASLATAADRFTYGNLPSVTAVTPSTGLVTGGTRVTIDGAGLSGATSVLFGSTPGVITSNTSTFITADSPAAAPGRVDVRVTTPAGTSTASPADGFTYLAGVPAAPLDVVAVADSSSTAHITWMPPDDGGSPILSNEIATYAGSSAPVFTTVGPVASAEVTGLTAGTSYRFSVTATNSVGPGPESHKSVTLVFENLPFTAGAGYRLVTAAGAVLAQGTDGAYGSAASLALTHPIVGGASTPDGHGYWLVASDGGVFAYGDAHFYGSTGGIHLNKPIVGMAVAPKGEGYWLVASDGGVFSFGDALFHGSTGGTRLNAPIVGMARDTLDGGYWLVASDGGVFAFGGAAFHGSTGGRHLDAPIVGLGVDAGSDGYWLVASDGGVFSFGGASFHGSTGGIRLNAPIAGMAGDADTDGYWLVASDGGVFAFGAPFAGSQSGVHLAAPVVAIEP